MTAKLTAEILNAALEAGQSASQIAADNDVSPGRVYQLMRRLGRSASKVQADQSSPAKGTTECKTFDGYRVCADGRVQSCWALGSSGQKTTQWRDIAIQIHRPGTLWAALYVRLGGSNRRQRPALLTVYLDAFGDRRQAKAEALHETMRKAMGLK